ncbi:hypothetical protein [Alteromonas gracilis]|uniref:MSHA biogenesis protein MshF n=1 Tax=Alteromonas gracilis TaxID=1479524 RepID=A0ABX5CRX1_9ALTE|nr:hypothetical protein [Alteromonas gracilis]PRO70324.1 hypothetical protein C6Y39_03575 [Alteromonas gracilis]
MAGSKTGLLNFVVIGTVLAIVLSSYIYHATSIVKEAEDVNKENAVAQFQRVVMLARAQWIKTKQHSVLIYETSLDASGNIQQKKDVAAELFVNVKGWPEGLAKGQGKACEYLYTLATLREMSMSSEIVVRDEYVNGYLQCAFFIHNRVWFEYNAGSGVVMERRS